MVRGGLFSRFFLEDGIREAPAYRTLDPARILAFADAARGLWAGLAAFAKPSEAETEGEFIFPVLDLLGWHHLPQQEPGRGRRDVADPAEAGAYEVIGNRWERGGERWLPLCEGKMVQAFDHRAAGISLRSGNRYRAAMPEPATLEQHSQPGWLPAPQFWVSIYECDLSDDLAKDQQWRQPMSFRRPA